MGGGGALLIWGTAQLSPGAVCHQPSLTACHGLEEEEEDSTEHQTPSHHQGHHQSHRSVQRPPARDPGPTPVGGSGGLGSPQFQAEGHSGDLVDGFGVPGGDVEQPLRTAEADGASGARG